jgi:Bacterial Ig-like domain
MTIYLKSGTSFISRTLNRALATAGTLAILLTCGCFGGGEVAPPSNAGASGVSGKVIQGAVSGATVFADKIVANGRGDMVMDSTESQYTTVTDSSGHFTLSATPPYDYMIVSRGGTDTLSGKPAGMMLAPAGAQNVSALTTMVALDPTLKTKMESLMGGTRYDADITLSVSPAALMLAKTIETSVQALTESLNPGGNTISSGQVNDIQLTTLSNLASQISSLNATELSSPASLQTMVTTAVTATATAIDSRYTNINIGSAATLASNIAATVPTIATAISGSATASLSSTGTSSEAAQLPTADQNALSAAVNVSVSQSSATVSVAPPTTTPDITAPTVTATTPASGTTGFSPNGSISADFSETLDLSTVTLANFSVTGATGGAVTWNSTSNSVTFSGNLPASSAVTVTLSGMKDLSGNTMTTKTWSFTTAAAPDTVKPTVTSTTPAALATGVNASTVSAVFSESMKTATMNGVTFSLMNNSSGLLVSGTVSYDISTRTISFTPSTKLSVATNYTATITTGAKDLSDNPLAAAATWSFTTTTTGSSTTVSNF